MKDIIITDIINQMSNTLTTEQLEHLKNVLYINLNGIEFKKESTALVDTGMNGDDYKIKMFIASKKAVNRQDNTLKQYAREIYNMLTFIGKPLEQITSMDLRYYYGMMREKHGISMVTMQTRLHYLSSFWDFMNTEELITGNPVKKVGSLKIEKTIKNPFSSEEMEALRDGCQTLRDRALLEFLYSTGVRVSELVQLNVCDIEMGKQELIVYGKGSKERKTYLTDAAKFYLKRYLNDRNAQDDEPLFTTYDFPHNRLTVAGVQYMLRKLGQRVGVKKVHPHRFRRTIATDLLSRGMPIEQVKTFLGHEKLDTTLIYCTVQDENVKSSHRKFA